MRTELKQTRHVNKLGTAKFVAVLGGTRAIAGKVTSASLDDIVFAVLAFGVLEGRVLVSLLEERRRRRRGLDSRLTTKYGGVAVVVALGVDTVVGGGDVLDGPVVRRL
eukprot:CAMPEP_0168217580 /NCGR_PEP_ID=MMETSP0140_2-20121125/7338_1 /TAXON_ID=44445 /ORGANISM="Pseudo-nitzschia australis, Strain 10249 10 AB" /LENGTH=107 /DNA_ID=CAMNT_0008145375 /DNA_START=54 /DNA_END=374 /DNA_ORIENTATION=-